MKTYFYFFIIFLLSCNSNSKSYEKVLGKWVLVSDSCNYYIFKKDTTIDVTHCIETAVEYDFDGSIVRKYFKIDSSIDNNAFIIECSKGSRFHLVYDYPFLIINPLKSKPKIRTHYTEPRVYVKENIYQHQPNFPDEPKLILEIPEILIDSIFYIAYGQEKGIEYIQDLSNTPILSIPSKGILKTTLQVDTRVYAYNNYIAYLKKESGSKVGIPVITHRDYNYIKENKIAFEKYLKNNKLSINDYILIAYRFNPDRSYLENKIFKQKVSNQVQDFKVVKLKDIASNGFIN